MARDVSVVIADDHPLLRQGLRQVIEADARFEIVGEAASGRAALDEIDARKPAVAILDIDMPDLDGFGVVRALRDRRIGTDIIFLTVHRDARLFNEALRLGAKGYVLKDSAASDIISCLSAVVAGQHYTSPALTSHLVRDRQAGPGPRAGGIGDMTPAERRILALIADYKTSREIAEALHISYRTVQTHRANICTKLDLQGSHALMKFALDHKAEL
jgi:DNA-binding NarL/FixJ family response regulator